MPSKKNRDKKKKVNVGLVSMEPGEQFSSYFSKEEWLFQFEIISFFLVKLSNEASINKTSDDLNRFITICGLSTSNEIYFINYLEQRFPGWKELYEYKYKNINIKKCFEYLFGEVYMRDAQSLVKIIRDSELKLTDSAFIEFFERTVEYCGVVIENIIGENIFDIPVNAAQNISERIKSNFNTNINMDMLINNLSISAVWLSNYYGAIFREVNDFKVSFNQNVDFVIIMCGVKHVKFGEVALSLNIYNNNPLEYNSLLNGIIYSYNLLNAIKKASYKKQVALLVKQRKFLEQQKQYDLLRGCFFEMTQVGENYHRDCSGFPAIKKKLLEIKKTINEYNIEVNQKQQLYLSGVEIIYAYQYALHLDKVFSLTGGKFHTTSMSLLLEKKEELENIANKALNFYKDKYYNNYCVNGEAIVINKEMPEFYEFQYLSRILLTTLNKIMKWNCALVEEKKYNRPEFADDLNLLITQNDILCEKIDFVAKILLLIRNLKKIDLDEMDDWGIYLKDRMPEFGQAKERLKEFEKLSKEKDESYKIESEKIRLNLIELKDELAREQEIKDKIKNLRLAKSAKELQDKLEIEYKSVLTELELKEDYIEQERENEIIAKKSQAESSYRRVMLELMPICNKGNIQALQQKLYESWNMTESLKFYMESYEYYNKKSRYYLAVMQSYNQVINPKVGVLKKTIHSYNPKERDRRKVKKLNFSAFIDLKYLLEKAAEFLEVTIGEFMKEYEEFKLTLSKKKQRALMPYYLGLKLTIKEFREIFNILEHLKLQLSDKNNIAREESKKYMAEHPEICNRRPQDQRNMAPSIFSINNIACRRFLSLPERGNSQHESQETIFGSNFLGRQKNKLQKIDDNLYGVDQEDISVNDSVIEYAAITDICQSSDMITWYADMENIRSSIRQAKTLEFPEGTIEKRAEFFI